MNNNHLWQKFNIKTVLVVLCSVCFFQTNACGDKMNYLWDEFKIKTFPAETIVFRNGVLDKELSTIEPVSETASPEEDFFITPSVMLLNKKYDLPIHIIYVGTIPSEDITMFKITVPDQKVFLTAKLENKKPAFWTLSIENTGKHSFVHAKVLIQNYDKFELITDGHHSAPDTGIIIDTKIIAHPDSYTKCTGIAKIETNCPNCESDIGFRALAAPSAKIEFTPKQFIKSVPVAAEHSASLYRGTGHQIEYLRESGLSSNEIKAVLAEAFINDI